MTIMCSTEVCPVAKECYLKLAIPDPIDQKYKDYRAGKKKCEYFIAVKRSIPSSIKK